MPKYVLYVYSNILYTVYGIPLKHYKICFQVV